MYIPAFLLLRFIVLSNFTEGDVLFAGDETDGGEKKEKVREECRTATTGTAEG